VTDPLDLGSSLTAAITSSRDRILKRAAMATYSIGDLSRRREILRMSALTGVASVISTRFAMAQAALRRTPAQMPGPFYPMKPLDQNADLTRVAGRPGRAEGQILTVMGRVLNLKGEPVRNAKVEIWQANAHGRYSIHRNGPWILDFVCPTYSVCTSTTPDTALIAPAICGETRKRPGSFISTSVSRSSIITSETSPLAPPAASGSGLA
jgi:Dioxygenase